MRATHQTRRFVLGSDGDIVASCVPDSRDPDPTTVEPLLLGRATRLVHGGHQIGGMAGVEASTASGALTGVLARQ